MADRCPHCQKRRHPRTCPRYSGIFTDVERVVETLSSQAGLSDIELARRARVTIAQARTFRKRVKV